MLGVGDRIRFEGQALRACGQQHFAERHVVKRALHVNTVNMGRLLRRLLGKARRALRKVQNRIRRCNSLACRQRLSSVLRQRTRAVARCRARVVAVQARRHPRQYAAKLTGRITRLQNKLQRDMGRLSQCRDASCRITAVRAISRDVRRISHCNARINSFRRVATVPSPPRPVHFFNHGLMTQFRAALASSRVQSPPAPPVPHRPFVQVLMRSVARAMQVQAPPPARHYSAPSRPSRRR